MLMFITRQGRRLAVVYAIATVLFNIFLCFHALGQTAGVDPKKLTLGIVSPVNQKEIEERFRDFVRYVARKVAASQPIEGSIVVAPSQSVLAKLLAEGKVDFYMESPYPTYLINNIYGAGRLFLRRWKGGMADYYALIFTRTTRNETPGRSSGKDHRL